MSLNSFYDLCDSQNITQISKSDFALGNLVSTLLNVHFRYNTAQQEANNYNTLLKWL